jgi:hypothetical protein
MHRINRRMLLGGTAGLVLAGAAQARRPAVTLASGDGNPLTPFYDSLMVRAECEWIGNEVIVLQQWLPDEGWRAHRVVQRLLIDDGFQVIVSSVYARADITLYLSGHRNGIDGISPVFTGGCFGTMFEGMTVIALALAAEDWTFPKDIPVADGLIPRNTIHHSAAWLDQSMRTPSQAVTANGDVVVQYQADPDKRRGEIEVLSREIAGEPLFLPNYPISY